MIRGEEVKSRRNFDDVIYVWSLYKTLNNTYPSFMQEYFIREDIKYDLRTRDLLQIPAAKSTTFGIDSIKFRVSLLRNSIPDLIKRVSSAAIFKRNIRHWDGEECNCKTFR